MHESTGKNQQRNDNRLTLANARIKGFPRQWVFNNRFLTRPNPLGTYLIILHATCGIDKHDIEVLIPRYIGSV